MTDKGKSTLSNLIEALQILLKYENLKRPTHCEHDVLTICMTNASIISEDDITLLEEFGFTLSGNGEGFYSFRYGSG